MIQVLVVFIVVLCAGVELGHVDIKAFRVFVVGSLLHCMTGRVAARVAFPKEGELALTGSFDSFNLDVLDKEFIILTLLFAKNVSDWFSALVILNPLEIDSVIGQLGKHVTATLKTRIPLTIL